MFLQAPNPGPSGRSRLALEQAAAALRAGDSIQAEMMLRKHLLAEPDDPDVLTKLAALLAGQSRMEESAILLRRAAAADPSPARQLALVQQLLALAGPTAALAEMQSFPAASREDLELRGFEAVLLGMAGKLDEQLALFDAIVDDHPRPGTMLVNQAFALSSAGRTDEAVAALRRALAKEPGLGDAYWALANLKSFEFSDKDIAAMGALLASGAPEAVRVPVHFALGRALEQRGKYDQSFEQYSAGNRLRAAHLTPEEMQVTPFVDAAIATFDASLFDRSAGSGCDASGPIFIIGLHRSGSTLIEQMLACHPLIEGLGELPVMPRILERIARVAARARRTPFEEIASLDRAAIAAIGAEYVERVQPFRTTDRPWFIDKLPANWLHTGFIRMILPNARIIDARRHPLACGFSNLKQHYPVGVNHSYSLRTIGRFYRDYLRLMDHFDGVLPGCVLHVVNERLIDEPEPELRRMLEFVGVPYDPSCLEFHSNKRAVQTPSAQQVRRPLNRDGAEAWRPYEPWLRELKDALGPALENWMPGGPQAAGALSRAPVRDPGARGVA